MHATEILLLAISVLTFGLGGFVYMKDRKSKTNLAFALVAVIAGLWPLSVTFFRMALEAEAVLFWARAIYVCAICFPAFFLFFAHVFPKKERGLSLARKSAFWIPPLIFGGILLFTDYWIKAVVAAPGNNGVALGSVYPAWVGWFILYTIWASLELFNKYREAHGTEKLQLAYVLLALAFPAFGSLPTNVIIPFFGNFRFIWIGPIFITAMLAMTSYAIAKYRLMDIRIVIQRGLLYLIMLGAITLIYFAFVFASGEILFRQRTDIAPLISAVLTALIATAGFPFIKKTYQNFTDKFFFKGEYESNQLLSSLTQIMTSSIDLETLTGGILTTLMKEMRLEKAAFLILDHHKITDIKGEGFSDQKNAVSGLETLVHTKPVSKRAGFIINELGDPKLKSLFETLNIAIAMPILVENEEVAILVLGPKRSGDPFYDKDFNLLDIFAAESGIAIQNAKAVTELRKFAKELEQRVEDRTAELEESQEKELAKAREIAKLKDEFVFIAAHELRTPLTAIRGFLELVSEAKANFPKDVKEHLDSIGQASSQLNQLIEDLLETARSEAGTLKVEAKPVDIVKLIESEIDGLQPLIQEKNLKINFEKDSKLPRVLADETKLKEVVSNLFSNAIKYNRESGRIDISLIREEDQMFIEFRDTGFGIPKNQQEKIFQKFFRAKGKNTEEVIGTGLGLFLTKMLVERMGGKLTFSSKEGEGSTFAFSLPVAVI